MNRRRRVGIYDVLNHPGTHDAYNDNYSLEHTLEEFVAKRYKTAIASGLSPSITANDLKEDFKTVYGNPDAYDADATLIYMERLGLVGTANDKDARPIIPLEQRRDVAKRYRDKHRDSLPKAPTPVL